MSGIDNCKLQQESQITRELAIANKECRNLETVISSLDDRLSAVLRKEVAFNITETDQAAEEEVVPLAREIRSIYQSIAICVTRINTLIQLVEL